MNTKESIKIKIIGSVTLVLVINLFAASALGGLLWLSARSVEAKAAARGKLVAMENAEKEGKELVELFAATAIARQKLAGSFVAERELVPFLESLEAAGKQSGAEVTLISVGAAGNLLQIGFTSSGDFASTCYLVELIEAMPRFTKFAAISISSAGKTAGNAGRWTGSYSLEVANYIPK